MGTKEKHLVFDSSDKAEDSELIKTLTKRGVFINETKPVELFVLSKPKRVREVESIMLKIFSGSLNSLDLPTHISQEVRVAIRDGSARALLGSPVYFTDERGDKVFRLFAKVHKRSIN